MSSFINGQISHWDYQEKLAELECRKTPGQASSKFLGSSIQPTKKYDLVIIGGGFTGLWTAYHNLRNNSLNSIAILEANTVGYGASGRNGGWLSQLFPGRASVYAKSRGIESVRNFQRMIIDSIGEVIDVTKEHDIDADIRRSGGLDVATSKAGVARLRKTREAELHYGLRPDEAIELDAEESRDRINIATTHAGLFHKNNTRINPAKLARGLANYLIDEGVEIIQGVRAMSIHPGYVNTNLGRVNAHRIVCCTEGYSGPLLGEGRVIPVNSSMIATEPISASDWEKIGWNSYELLGDTAHTFIYAQRTADDRIAIGGRGSPYGYGGDTAADGRLLESVVDQLVARLGVFFPQVDFEVAHAWRGVLGVTRDWCATVNWDDDVSIGYVFGYAGHGVTSTYLAGKTMANRIAQRHTPATELPWNNHDSGRWEPDPIRWLGIHSLYKVFGASDIYENRFESEKTPWPAKISARIAGMD